MKKFLVFLCTLLLTFGVAIGAQADIIFSGGTPDHSTGVIGCNVAGWVTADDFMLTSDALLADVHFWTAEEGQWNETVGYYLFNDNSGSPTSAPFASGIGQNIVKAATGVGVSPGGSRVEYEYSFDLVSPIPLMADTRYWLGLHVSEDFVVKDIVWEETNEALGHNAYCAANGNFSSWDGLTYSMAFNLTDAAPVPEPATMLLLGSGLIGLAAFRRKFRKS